jgi:hypothetical protein
MIVYMETMAWRWWRRHAVLSRSLSRSAMGRISMGVRDVTFFRETRYFNRGVLSQTNKQKIEPGTLLKMDLRDNISYGPILEALLSI